ncbi:hypothetical protein [Dyadobacter psychrotolerans]|uniref:DUF2029 domain-containing protein n=1 Tax=Dyadobacter psychrotolerans TaxID=2541721 RepID=A0A4V2Z382_9BACT|nr:hypothetical protein [Dyadobacter psychrotolerans]TDE11678.1 hypothetical protein E0F88_24960 [Dyadobacter psychrotolerans]
MNNSTPLLQSNQRVVKILLIIAGLLYLVSDVFYLLNRYEIHQGDLSLYYNIATQMLSGKIPYKDFRIEYPALAILPIIIPGIVNHLFHGGFESYCAFFVVQNIIFAITTGFIIFFTKIGSQKTIYTLSTYVIICLFSLPVYLYRYDAFPAMLTSIVVYSIFQKPLVSGIALSAAVAAKLYPIVMGPAIAIYFILNRNLKRGLIFLSGALLFLAVAGCTILPFTGTEAFDFLRYHQIRGIQIESVPGGLLLLANKVGLIPVRIIQNFGSLNIDAPTAKKVAEMLKLVVPVVFTFLFVFQCWVFYKENQIKGYIEQISVIRALSMWIFIFLIFNKVLSPQYLIWLFPFIPFLNPGIRIKFTVALILTITIFPGWYFYLVTIHPTFVALLNTRNLLLIWILADLANLMVRSVFDKTARQDADGNELAIA